MTDVKPQGGVKVRNTLLSPGSATVHKGEPSATEIAKLRFSLSREEEDRLDSVLADSLEQYQELSADRSRLDDQLATVGELMHDEGWSTAR